MSEEQLAKLLELGEFIRLERIVADLFKEISSLNKQISYNSQYKIRHSLQNALTIQKNLAIEKFSKAQDEFYKLLQEVFPDSIELEDVWSTYVSWFRPWNSRQNNGELREIIGEPWKKLNTDV